MPDVAITTQGLGKRYTLGPRRRGYGMLREAFARTIQALCQRGVLLERGRVLADAPVNEAIERYLRTLEHAAAGDLLGRADRDQRGWQATLVKAIGIEDATGGTANAVVGGRPIRFVVHLTESLPLTECRLTIANSLGQRVSTFDSEISAPSDRRDHEMGTRIECIVDPLTLLPGRYRLDVLVKGRRQIQDGLLRAAFFDVEPGVIDGRPMPASGADGSVAFPHTWRLPG